MTEITFIKETNCLVLTKDVDNIIDYVFFNPFAIEEMSLKEMNEEAFTLANNNGISNYSLNLTNF